MATIMSLEGNQKLFRAFKRSGLFFGLAVVSVLIPMLHFVLVPAFLIVSIVMFVKTMSETKIATALEGECPSCHKKIDLVGAFKLSGSKESCPQCRQLLRISFDEVK